MATYSVSLAKILKDHQFEPLYLPKDPSEIFITTPDVHRPGLTIAGFDNFFDCTRINFLGKAEVEFINSLEYGHTVLRSKLDNILRTVKISCNDNAGRLL